MSENLTEQVLDVIIETQSTMNEYDQRSAIGMAESHLRTGRAIVRQAITPALYQRRDDLAERLVEIVGSAPHDDAKEALRMARDYINAPFLDPTMNGQKDKARIDKPGGRNAETGTSA